MTDRRLMIVTTAPAEAVESILGAISAAGAGVIGLYTHCAFTSPGTGRFQPAAAANPHLGVPGQINTVEEVRIETFCPREKARAVVNALRSAHPYEEPVIYLLSLLSEAEL